MNCRICGNRITGTDVFCTSCGTRINRSTGSGVRKTLRSIPIAAKFAAGGVTLVIVIIIVVTAAIHASYDLSGSYRTSANFPVSRIVFSTDGTFVAYNEYETLYGRYSKHGSTYSLRFVNGKTGSGNAVMGVIASNEDALFELEARKISERQLRIEVIPKISYWAWFGKSVDFYR